MSKDENSRKTKAYLSADRFLNLLGSEYGAKIREIHPEFISEVQKILDKYKTAYFDERLVSNGIAGDIFTEISEAMAAKGLTPESSIESIKQLDDIITKNSSDLQSVLLFDPETFYEKYLLSLASGSITEKADITNNERFTTWFRGSQVVDKNGKPLIVYHGTGGLKYEFDVFKFSPFPGAYFAVNKSYSEWFTKLKGSGGKKGLLYQVYLRVLNPMDLTPFAVESVPYDDFVNYIKFKYGFDLPENKMLRSISEQYHSQGKMWAWRYIRAGVNWIKYIAEKNYFDGFHYFENNPDDQVNGKENVTEAWMVFKANQIKAVDQRNTSYSLFSNSIKMEAGGVV